MSRLPDALVPGDLDPVEPLSESAPVAWAAAPQLCHRDPGTGESCASFHRVWQYLRLLGVITSIRTNTDFLMGRFRERARTGSCSRVLISATADYSMLAHLTRAYDAEHATLDATVVDRCETALLLNRWYADRYRVRLTTVSCDALKYRTEHPFDLLCTHNFLSRFDAFGRKQLVARWGALLRPGGVVITTQRVRPNAREARNVYTDEEARSLLERVMAATRHQPLDVNTDELCRTVYAYAMRKDGYVIRTMAEVVDLFEHEDFDIELADEGGGPAERRRDRPSSPAGEDTYRMRIVARRR
jgi:hypothetical protein